METLQIEKANAIKAYEEANDKGKMLLSNLFGKKVFMKKITDRIKTWEDAADEMQIDPVDALPFKYPVSTFQHATNAFFKLDTIATVLNEGVELDWTNNSQKKWYPYFNNYSSGSGFSFGGTDYGWSVTVAYGGARLCVHSQELAEYFGKQFLSIFNQFLNPKK